MTYTKDGTEVFSGLDISNNPISVNNGEAATWAGEVQEKILSATSAVSSRTNMKLLDTSYQTMVSLYEGERSGLFEWDGTISVATHQADTQEGIYVAPNAAAVGAFVRVVDGPYRAEWFGAEPNNSGVNSQTGIQAALDAIPLVGGQRGGEVALLSGYYYTTANISIGNGQRLTGQGGEGGTVIQASDATFSAVSLDGVGSQFEGVRVACTAANDSITNAITIDNVRAKINDVRIINYKYGLEISAGRYEVNSLKIDTFSDANGVGITIDVGTSVEAGIMSNTLVEGDASARPFAAIQIKQATGVDFDKCQFMQCSHNLHVNSSSAYTNGCTSVKFNQCWFDNATANGVYFQGDNSRRFVFTDCWIASSGARGVSFDATVVEGVMFHGCEVYDNAASGIDELAGCTLTGLDVADCLFSANSYDIILTATDNASFIGNKHRDQGGFTASTAAMSIASGCTGTIVKSGIFTGSWTDNGVSTVATGNSFNTVGGTATTPDRIGNHGLADS